MRNAEVLQRDRQRRLPDRARPVQHRDQRAAAAAGRRRNASELETELRASLNDAEERADTAGAHIVMIGILPTLGPSTSPSESLSANPRYALLNEQIFAARGEDCTSPSTGPERLATSADTIAPEAACTSVQFHLQVSPQEFAAELERRAVHRRRAARARRQLAVPLRQGALARDADRAVRAGHRHPSARSSRTRACGRGCGSASAGSPRSSTSSRRTSATSRRCCRSSTTRTRSRCSTRGDTPDAGRAAHAQRHHLPLEPAGLRRGTAASRTCGWRTGCCRPGRRSSTSWPTAPSTTACCARWPSEDRPMWTRMSFAAAEDNFDAGARRRHRRPASTGPASARCRPPSWCCAGCCRWRTQGLDALGRRRRRQRPAARHHRAALHRPPQRRRVAGADVPRTSTSGVSRWTGATSLREMLRRYIELMHSNEPVAHLAGRLSHRAARRR